MITALEAKKIWWIFLYNPTICELADRMQLNNRKTPAVEATLYRLTSRNLSTNNRLIISCQYSFSLLILSSHFTYKAFNSI